MVKKGTVFTSVANIASVNADTAASSIVVVAAVLLRRLIIDGSFI